MLWFTSNWVCTSVYIPNTSTHKDNMWHIKHVHCLPLTATWIQNHTQVNVMCVVSVWTLRSCTRDRGGLCGTRSPLSSTMPLLHDSVPLNSARINTATQSHDGVGPQWDEWQRETVRCCGSLAMAAHRISLNKERTSTTANDRRHCLLINAQRIQRTQRMRRGSIDANKCSVVCWQW